MMLQALALLVVLQEAPNWVSRIGELEKSYGLTVEFSDPSFPVKTTHGDITAERAVRRELAAYVPIFAEEFSRYPADFVKKTGVRRIVLCKNLAFAGDVRASIPYYDHTVMFYDAVRGAYSEDYQRATVHHEFFHMIDWKDDGRVYDDDAWARLNRAGFEYGSRHVRGVDRSMWGRLDDNLEGFLNRYAMTGVQEDKAEIFCYMIFKPELIERRSRTDAVLAAKVEAMKKLTLAFSASMDEAFWAAAASR